MQCWAVAQNICSSPHPAYFLCHRIVSSSFFFQVLCKLPTRPPDPRALYSLSCLFIQLKTQQIQFSLLDSRPGVGEMLTRRIAFFDFLPHEQGPFTKCVARFAEWWRKWRKCLHFRIKRCHAMLRWFDKKAVKAYRELVRVREHLRASSFGGHAGYHATLVRRFTPLALPCLRATVSTVGVAQKGAFGSRGLQFRLGLWHPQTEASLFPR